MKDEPIEKGMFMKSSKSILKLRKSIRSKITAPCGYAMLSKKEKYILRTEKKIKFLLKSIRNSPIIEDC